MDLETLLVHLYVLVEGWWQRTHPRAQQTRSPAIALSPSEVLTLAYPLAVAEVAKREKTS